MTEVPIEREPEHQPPRSDLPVAPDAPVVSTDPSESGTANLVYILYLVALAAGITGIVGVIVAYVSRGDAPEWLESHYTNQIHIFWKAILYSLIGALLSIVLVGFLVLFATFVWYIVRVVKGMQSLSRGEAYPNPTGWGF